MRIRQASTAPIWKRSFNPPKRLSGDGWHLIPLHPDVAESDRDAFRSCSERLRTELDWNGWPPEQFTLEDNIRDLADHYEEFVRREAYAYSIQTPDSCIGCIYIEPWNTRAQLAFWVVDSWLDRESQILTAILNWLEAWPVEGVIVPMSQHNTRGQAVLEDLGLQRCEGPESHVSFRR